MNSMTILAAVLCLMACQKRPINESYGEKELNELRYLKEVLWPKSYRDQDTLLLNRILADNFQMIDADGVWSDKASELKWIQQNPWAVDSFRYEIKRLEILENGTAFICGTGYMINDSTHAHYQSSNVLIKINGFWKAVLSHVSGYKEE